MENTRRARGKKSLITIAKGTGPVQRPTCHRKLFQALATGGESGRRHFWKITRVISKSKVPDRKERLSAFRTQLNVPMITNAPPFLLVDLPARVGKADVLQERGEYGVAIWAS